MGLATVYGTMKRHGGDAQLDSTLGKGTIVRLIFPRCEIAVDRTADEAMASPKPMRILCIDDEPLLRQSLKEALESEGHTVEVADGGGSGLSVFRAAYRRGEPFQVVITDLGMPHVDGRKVSRAIKSEVPETSVILLTGWGQRLQSEGTIPDEVDLMLCKPPKIEMLNQALSQIISEDSRSDDP